MFFSKTLGEIPKSCFELGKVMRVVGNPFGGVGSSGNSVCAFTSLSQSYIDAWEMLPLKVNLFIFAKEVSNAHSLTNRVMIRTP